MTMFQTLEAFFVAPATNTTNRETKDIDNYS